MPNEIDGIVSEAGSGTERIAGIDANHSATDSGANRTDDTEIIGGFTASEPATERIFEIPPSDDSGIRRTKSGAIDGRSARRGRPRKNAGDTTETGSKTGVPLGGLAFGDLLEGIHAMLAGMTRTPELKLGELPDGTKESEKLGKAISDLSKCYGHVIDPKVAAWLQLGMVCSAVYGTRIAAIRMRLKNEAREKRLKVTSISEGVNGAPKVPQETVTAPPMPIERDGLM